MKAIAIFEMPDYCFQCPCRMSEEEVDECFCGISLEKIGGIFDDKPKWCPLRPMPQKAEAYAISNTDRAVVIKYSGKKYHPLYAQGWNACLDEIMGTQECASCEDYKKWDGEDVGWCEAGKGVVDSKSVCTRIVRKEK